MTHQNFESFMQEKLNSFQRGEVQIEIDETIPTSLSISLEDRLRIAKETVYIAQEKKSVNPKIMVELLENVMVLQSLSEKSTYSTAETLRHFQGKIDKQRWDDPTPPNIALYLFWQVWAALFYSAITIGVLLIAYVPAANYCQRRESPFCTGIHNMRTYVVGESKPSRILPANLSK